MSHHSLNESCAGLFTICRATAHVHGLVRSLPRVVPVPGPLVSFCMLYRYVKHPNVLACCTAGHKEASKRQQTAATGRPTARGRVITASRKHAVIEQVRAPVAPPKQLKASGESPLAPENKYWHDDSCAGLFPICRATAQMHGLVKVLP